MVKGMEMDEVVELFGKYSCARMLNLNCKVLGLVISGCRYIYDSERCVEVGAGSMFLLGEGLHFVKDMPTQDGERVCIVEIEITQALMQSAIISLINDYEVENFDQFKDCDTLHTVHIHILNLFSRCLKSVKDEERHVRVVGCCIFDITWMNE